MDINKIRFIEPGNRPYRPSIKNYYVYDKYIRTPSIGINTLATIVHHHVKDTLMYSEAISKIKWDDVLDADIIFIGMFTFQAIRGYEIADHIRKNSNAIIVFGGLHPTMATEEALAHCDYILLGEGDETILEFINSLLSDSEPDFPGVSYMKNGEPISTGMALPPENIDIIPNRHLIYNYKKMTGHNTIWPQVHGSRGCPHDCDYCAVVRLFGHRVRKRSPESIVEDIKQSIAFFEEGTHRLAKMLWLTDDNFFADREWAKEVLNAIIGSGIKYNFTIQARFEVGFDDEMLELLKRAGFVEVAMGIEFLEDETFERYNKKSSCDEIIRSVRNIQSHGIRTRGLFIMGADNHTIGVGDRLADFVIKYDITGVLIQSMYFIPGTPVYEAKKDKLLHTDWSKYKGMVVHEPESISACELNREIIKASKKIYSVKRLTHAILKRRGLDRTLFIGEFFWQKNVRKELRSELKLLNEDNHNFLATAQIVSPDSL